MKSLLFAGLFVCFVSNLLAGQTQIKQKSNLSEREIQEEATRSLEQWNYYMRNDLDSLKLDAYHILLIGMEAKNDFAINVGKRSIGSYLIRTGQQTRGIKYLKQAHDYFEKKENLVLLTEILNEIGNAYLYLGKPIEAEKYYLKSLKIGKDSPDPTSSFLAEANLAQAYINLGNYEKAAAILHHYKNESLKKLKLEAVSSAYALLGTIEQQRENLPLAMEYFRKSAEFGFRSKAKSQIGHAYTNMAIVYFQENDLAASLDYFKKALAIRMQTKNAKAVSESYFNLGDYYSGIEQFEESLKYYDLSSEYSKRKNLLKEELDAIYAKASVHKLMKKWELAISEMEKYAALQKEYYSELSVQLTEDSEILESLDQMEIENNAESHQANLLSVIDNQKYHKNILYAVLTFSCIAFLVLAIYKKSIN